MGGGLRTREEVTRPHFPSEATPWEEIHGPSRSKPTPLLGPPTPFSRSRQPRNGNTAIAIPTRKPSNANPVSSKVKKDGRVKLLLRIKEASLYLEKSAPEPDICSERKNERQHKTIRNGEKFSTAVESIRENVQGDRGYSRLRPACRGGSAQGERIRVSRLGFGGSGVWSWSGGGPDYKWFSQCRCGAWRVGRRDLGRAKFAQVQ